MPPHGLDPRVRSSAQPTETEMPFYLVWLEGEDGRRHLLDTEPIEAESQEDALKIVMGGALFMPPDVALRVDMKVLRRMFDEQASPSTAPAARGSS